MQIGNGPTVCSFSVSRQQFVYFLYIVLRIKWQLWNLNLKLPLPVFLTSLTIKAGCPMRLEKFPMDTQKCPLKLGSCKFAWDWKEIIPWPVQWRMRLIPVAVSLTIVPALDGPPFSRLHNSGCNLPLESVQTGGHCGGHETEPIRFGRLSCRKHDRPGSTSAVPASIGATTKGAEEESLSR